MALSCPGKVQRLYPEYAYVCTIYGKSRLNHLLTEYSAILLTVFASGNVLRQISAMSFITDSARVGAEGKAIPTQWRTCKPAIAEYD